MLYQEFCVRLSPQPLRFTISTAYPLNLETAIALKTVLFAHYRGCTTGSIIQLNQGESARFRRGPGPVGTVLRAFIPSS